MNKKIRVGLIAGGIVWFVGLLAWYLHRANFAVLSPAGIMASKERRLMFITVLLGAIVIIPVYILTFLIAWRYRETNKNARYQPDFSNHLGFELTWWGIPSAIILVLSVITWQTSHSLDPGRPLASRQAVLPIQVVALDWKWLFIYPQQGIASVNYVALPVGRPVSFSITADAPMNSFWIPQLGGQIYAMPGMATHLNLMAGKIGDYQGSSANISGAGFADMRFTAHAASEADFKAWMQTAKQSGQTLSATAYHELAAPSTLKQPQQFAAVAPNLFHEVLMQYMAPHQELR